MQQSTTTFYFIKSGVHGSLDGDMQTISNQLGTHTNSGFGLQTDKTSITISYTNTDIQSTLSIEPKAKYKDAVISSQMTLVCDKSDNISVNLLKGIVKSMGYRVYNPSISGYSTVDPNILDLSTSDINAKILHMFEVKKLVPIFQYINTLIFYAKDPKDDSIHLTNCHLIQSALDSKTDIKNANNFSVKIAPDIATFVALADRGVIPGSFYHSLHSNNKRVYHHNISGFNIDQANTDTYLSPVFFHLDRTKQSFVSLGNIKSINILEKIKKGGSITKFVSRAVKQNEIGPLIAVKYPNNIQFLTENNGRIFPRMNISIFVDQQ